MPSASGLTKAGNSLQPRKLARVRVATTKDGVGTPASRTSRFATALSRAAARCERVGEQIRLIEQLAQRRHLRLARAALHALPRSRTRDRSARRRRAARQAPDRGRRAPTSQPSARKRASELIDGLDVVELGHLLLGEAERAIVVAQIVDERDTHQRFSARRPIRADRPVGIGVAVGLALEILEDQVVALAAHDIVGEQRDLAAAAGRVDHIGRHGVAGRMAAQALR